MHYSPLLRRLGLVSISRRVTQEVCFRHPFPPVMLAFNTGVAHMSIPLPHKEISQIACVRTVVVFGLSPISHMFSFNFKVCMCARQTNSKKVPKYGRHTWRILTESMETNSEGGRVVEGVVRICRTPSPVTIDIC